MKMQENQDMIKVVIVDDEPQSILRLQNDLVAFGDFDVVATSSSARSAKTLVLGMQPDVLVIDVEMPGQTGLEVLQSLREEMSMNLIVIFYSAFDKYMIDALRASAFDFLLKPYQPEELELIVERVRKKMREQSKVGNEAQGAGAKPVGQDALDLDGLAGTPGKHLAAQTISGLLIIKPDEVFSCTFMEDTHLWHLKLANGQEYKLRRQTTAKIILAMSPSLAQVRQDCIVNLDYLISIENYSLRCVFAPPFDQENIIVSRRCYKTVKEHLEIL